MKYFGVLVVMVSLLSVARSDVTNVTCPKAEDIRPCVCYPDSAQVWCVGKDVDDDVLKTVAPKVKTDHSVFHLLLISETKLKTIEKNAFSEVAFERVFIQKNHDLTKIDVEAFKPGNATVLVIQDNPILESTDTFGLARHLMPNDKIEMNGNFFKEVPVDALRGNPLNSTLSYIYLTNNTYNEKIGKDAFVGHPWITTIGVDNNNLHSVDEYAFNLSPAHILVRHVTINLNKNKLMSSSFKNNTFVFPSNIYATIHFENNLFTDLDENIFKHLAAEGNKLYFGGNQFICDCKMAWILDKPQSTNIYNVNCINHNSRSIFSLRPSELVC